MIGNAPRPSPALVVAIVALIVALAGVGVAAIPSKTGVITSCFNSKSGAARIVDEKKKCKKGEKRLTWNQQGPAGTAGQPGPPGSDAQFNGAAAGGDLTGTYPAPQVAPDALTGAEVNEGTLAKVPSAGAADVIGFMTAGHIFMNTSSGATSGECNAAAGGTTCESININTSISDSRYLVIGTAGWRGAAAGPDSGSCGLTLDSTTMPTGFNNVDFGQAGDEHAAAASLDPLVIVEIMSAAAGQHTVRLMCDEAGGDIRIHERELRVIKLAG